MERPNYLSNPGALFLWALRAELWGTIAVSSSQRTCIGTHRYPKMQENQELATDAATATGTATATSDSIAPGSPLAMGSASASADASATGNATASATAAAPRTSSLELVKELPRG